MNDAITTVSAVAVALGVFAAAQWLAHCHRIARDRRDWPVKTYTPPTEPVPPWSWEREQKYHDLAAYFGEPYDRASTSAFELHKRIVRIIDGREPDPRHFS